jgi:hypothetical protein
MSSSQYQVPIILEIFVVEQACVPVAPVGGTVGCGEAFEHVEVSSETSNAATIRRNLLIVDLIRTSTTGNGRQEPAFVYDACDRLS